MKTLFTGVVALFCVLVCVSPCKAEERRQRTVAEWVNFFHKDARLGSLCAVLGRPASVRGNIYLFVGALADGSNGGGMLAVSVTQVAEIDVVVGMGMPDEKSMKTFPWMAAVDAANNPPSPAQAELDSQIRVLDAQIATREREFAAEVARQRLKQKIYGGLPEFYGQDALLLELNERREFLQRKRATAR